MKYNFEQIRELIYVTSAYNKAPDKEVFISNSIVITHALVAYIDRVNTSYVLTEEDKAKYLNLKEFSNITKINTSEFSMLLTELFGIILYKEKFDRVLKKDSNSYNTLGVSVCKENNIHGYTIVKNTGKDNQEEILLGKSSLLREHLDKLWELNKEWVEVEITRYTGTVCNDDVVKLRLRSLKKICETFYMLNFDSYIDDL